jgi:hypothetical protein
VLKLEREGRAVKNKFIFLHFDLKRINFIYLKNKRVNFFFSL